MFSVFETFHDEHIIAVREEPVLDLVFYQRHVTDGMCEPFLGVQDSTSTSGKRVSGCLSECPTKTLFYLKPVRILGGTSMVSICTVAIVILSSRRQRSTKNLSYMLKSG